MQTDPVRQMKLGFNIVANGAHVAGWRMPEAQADAAMRHPPLEGHGPRMRNAPASISCFGPTASRCAIRPSDDDELSFNPRIDVFEPLTVIGALAAVTERLGFVASASTTYNEPYHVARKFASLDYVTEGRGGLECGDLLERAGGVQLRSSPRTSITGIATRRAEEFVDVVFGLWDSWEDDAFIRDKTERPLFRPVQAPHAEPSAAPS